MYRQLFEVSLRLLSTQGDWNCEHPITEKLRAIFSSHLLRQLGFGTQTASGPDPEGWPGNKVEDLAAMKNPAFPHTAPLAPL